ncbi:HTH-type transcriptional regulator LutR [Streptomyces sp. ADI92-24]|nr:HTH-type transcriptional regulator LutR [Streptomyces sp. ADI92-24]
MRGRARGRVRGVTGLYAASMQPSAPSSPSGSERPGPVADPARRGLLTERIARQLEHDIRSGEIAVGTKLPSERELAAQFGSSRNVVREVLRRLEAQHLIEVAPGRGSFVREQSSGQARGYDALYRAGRPTVRQLIEARIPLEVEMVRLATQRATDEDIAAMRTARDALESATDVVVKAQADMDFHDAIAVASENPVLRIMLSSISGMMFEMMLRSNSDPSIGEAGVPHHPEIFEAVEARDVDLACARMREHLLLGLRTYGADLDLQVDTMARNHIETLLGQAEDRRGGDRTGA